VTVRLDPEDVAWLDAASDDKGGIGRAEVLRRLVETQRRRGPAQWLPVNRPGAQLQGTEELAAAV